MTVTQKTLKSFLNKNGESKARAEQQRISWSKNGYLSVFLQFFSFVVVVLVAQSCLTLCDPMNCSPPGSSVHGIIQARILEWGAIPFSRGSSQPRDWNSGLLQADSSPSEPPWLLQFRSGQLKITLDEGWEDFPLSYVKESDFEDGKESACNAGDTSSIPELGRSPGEGNSYLLQYACLENSMDRRTRQAIEHGVTKSQTQLSN